MRQDQAEEASDTYAADRTDSELELLEALSIRHLAPEGARGAWGELYCRHSRYVAAVAARALGKRGGDSDLVADIVDGAFLTLVDWTGRHSGELAQRFGCSTPDGLRLRLLGFLATVARRLVVRTQRRAPRESLSVDLDNVACAPREAPRTGSSLEAILELLSLEEADALRMSLPWYQPETGTFAFPRGEAALLARELGASPEALRQRRCRGLKHLHARLLRESPLRRSQGRLDH